PATTCRRGVAACRDAANRISSRLFMIGASRAFASPPLRLPLEVLELNLPHRSKRNAARSRREPAMIALFKGLGLLLRDNELYHSPFEKQVAHWRSLSEQQIRDEVAVLAQAKCQWLIASIVGWQAASLLILGL